MGFAMQTIGRPSGFIWYVRQPQGVAHFSVGRLRENIAARGSSATDVTIEYRRANQIDCDGYRRDSAG
jgi:hypothetical protein